MGIWEELGEQLALRPHNQSKESQKAGLLFEKGVRDGTITDDRNQRIKCKVKYLEDGEAVLLLGDSALRLPVDFHKIVQPGLDIKWPLYEPKYSALSQTDRPKFNELVNKFNDEWDDDAKIVKPRIKEIYDIHDPVLEERFEKYAEEIGDVKPYHEHGEMARNPGNILCRFHGMPTACAFRQGKPCGADNCASCGVVAGGFMMKHCRSGRDMFGKGLYTTPNSSTAAKYAKPAQSRVINGVVIMVAAVMGTIEKIDGATIDDDLARKLRGSGCAPNANSRMITSAWKARPYEQLMRIFGVPLVRSHDEVITFKDQSLLPKYLFVFETSGEV